MKDFKSFLETVPAFSEFSREELEMLEKAMVVESFDAGHVFVAEGRPADRVYLLVDGTVEVTRERVLRRGFDVLKTVSPGELFGLVSLIDHRDHSATCSAVGAVTVAYLPRSAFELLFRAHARVGWHFQKLIAQQLVHDLRTYTGLLAQRAAERSV